MEGTIGEIRMFAGNFAPRSWAYCAGQLIAISQNEALFSILGCTYGGDCRTSFGLPDLRGRSPINPGTGPGLPTYRQAQRGGTEHAYLNATNLASHTHTISGSVAITASHKAINDMGTTGEPDGAVPAVLDGRSAYSGDFDGTMGADAVNVSANLITTNAGASIGVTTVGPTLAMNYIICLFGLYPSRN